MTDDESIVAGGTSAGDYEVRSSAQRSGELRLMLAILEDAIVVFVKSLSGRVDESDARAARAWLNGRGCSPFTFEYVCDVLGFDSLSVRRAVWAMQAQPALAAARLARRRQPGHLAPGTRSATVREATARAAVPHVAQ
jgi:hypothetical protein